MRVLFVAPVAVHGGAGQVLLNLVATASHGGYEPHVVWLGDGPLIGDLGATAVSSTLVDAGRLRSPRAFVRACRGLAAIIRRVDPDVVFATEAKGHLYASMPARRAGLPSIWRQPATPSPTSPMDRLATLLPTACIVVASEHVARAQRELWPTRRPRVIAPGIDITRYAGQDEDAIRTRHDVAVETPLIGIVGRLQPWKGQHIFLRAAARVVEQHPETRFAVIGGADMGWEVGDYPAELVALARELGLEDRVIFTGQTNEVPAWLGALDICVNASDHEPFGLVILEAMAAGVPMIAVANGGPAEIIRDRETGLLIAERTPELLGQAMIDLIADQTFRARLAASARTVIAERYSRERLAADMGALMREVAPISGGHAIAMTPP